MYDTMFTMQVDYLSEHLLLTSKPIVYLLNMSEDDYIRKKNKWCVRSIKLISVRVLLENDIHTEL